VIVLNTLVLLAALAAVTLAGRMGAPESYQGSVPDVSYQGSVPDVSFQVLSPGGPVTNIYPYAKDGTPLTDVLLYDQNGNPIEMAAGGNEGDGVVRHYPFTPNGRAITNAYPQEQTTEDQSQYPPVISRVPSPKVVVPTYPKTK
jgi:hypothetical protein